MTLSEEDIAPYVGGKCMDLSAALHRVTGWEIQAVVEPANGGYPPYVGHTWCIDPASGDCVDIDGAYPMSTNGWLHPSNRLVTGLNEVSLRELTLAGANRSFTPAEWDCNVLDAFDVLHSYLLPLIGK
jgi:hypothetical protein